MKKSHVAMARCYFCGESDKILLATRYDHRGEPLHDLEPLNGKVIDMDPCTKCKELMSKGVILLTINDSMSEKNWNIPPRRYPGEKDLQWMPNPYRTGGFFVITDDAIRRAVQPEEMAEWAIKRRWMFIEHEAAERLGLFAMTPTEENNDPASAV